MTHLDTTLMPSQQLTLLGHGKVHDDMMMRLRNGTLPPCWILHGQEGIGKATLAYHIARTLLCDMSTQKDLMHRLFQQDAHPNLITLRATQDTDGKWQPITVNQVRTLITFLGQSATQDGWRVVLIDAMDHLNISAANAMLKILEEPPSQVLFLLVTHHLSGVLPTIRSRCCHQHLMPLSVTELKTIFPKATELDLAISRGSPGTLARWLTDRAAQWIPPLIQQIRYAMLDKFYDIDTFLSKFDKKAPQLVWFFPILSWILERMLYTPYPRMLQEALPIDQDLLQLYQLKPPQHWVQAQEAVLTLMHATTGSHLDPLHTLFGAFCLVHSPSLISELR